MQNSPLIDHFRCPPEYADAIISATELSRDAGFFNLGGRTLYGRCSSLSPARSAAEPLPELNPYAVTDGPAARVPFEPAEIVRNLQGERYLTAPGGIVKNVAASKLITDLYYRMRPLFSVPIRKQLQQIFLSGWQQIPFPTWPVDCTVSSFLKQMLLFSMKARHEDRVPFIWFWPNGASACLILTHDVETSAGVAFCSKLMDLNDAFGIKASFQIIPEERYNCPAGLLQEIKDRGFELNVHDLNHDGRLLSSRKEFESRAVRIRHYRTQWEASGFRSGAMYRNLDWYDELGFDYDMSVPNVAHLDPQRGGCCSVHPFLIGNTIELPLTTIQDYSLFHILNTHATTLWEEQISRIQKESGLLSFIIHPDYILESRERDVYVRLLDFLSSIRAASRTWVALPREVACWWRMRSGMSLVKDGSGWSVEGEGSERARVAFAVRTGDDLTFEFSRD